MGDEIRPMLVIPTLEPDKALETADLAEFSAGVHVRRAIIYDKHGHGFTKTANEGLRCALREGATHVVMMNDDIRIETGNWLVHLISAIRSGTFIAAVSPTGKCRTQPICFGTKDTEPAIRFVTQLPMFCTVISTVALAQVGLLDERYIHYGSDSDWCERAKRARYKLAWCTYVYVKNELSPIKKEWKEHDMALFRKEWW